MGVRLSVVGSRLSVVGSKVKFGKKVGHLRSAISHLIKYLVRHFKVGHVKTLVFSEMLLSAENAQSFLRLPDQTQFTNKMSENQPRWLRSLASLCSTMLV